MPLLSSYKLPMMVTYVYCLEFNILYINKTLYTNLGALFIIVCDCVCYIIHIFMFF